MDVKAEIKFTKLAELGGNGWNSKVYRGTDPQLRAELVFKRIEKKNFTDPDTFFEEAQHLYSARHPNVLEVKYACQENEYIWMAMPYCSNGSLQQLIEARFLTPREVVKYGIEFLTGLHHIHNRQLVHLDVKPANILLSDTNVALLADFGCSRALDEHSLAEPLQSYPLHQVPERLGQNPASKLGIEADIYQAGLTLYRLANGDELFFAPIGGRKGPDEIKDNKIRNKLNEKIRKGKYPERSAYLPHIPEKLRRIICKAVELDPDNRFHSASDFINALSEVETCLDWQYSNSNGIEKFLLDTGANLIEMLIIVVKAGYEIRTHKTVKMTGTPRSIVECCVTLPNRDAAIAAAKKFAEELSS